MTGVVCAALIGNEPNFAAGQVVCATVIANDLIGRNRLLATEVRRSSGRRRTVGAYLQCQLRHCDNGWCSGHSLDALVIALAEPNGAVLTSDVHGLGALAAQANRVTVLGV
jgi:hypothetical protein